MKKHKILITIFLAGVILVPILVFAQGRGRDKSSEAGANVCETIEKIYSKIEERITKREESLKNKEDNILNKVKERRKEREEEKEQRREKWDENRAEHFAKLEEKAVSDEQKQAVLAFVETINGAVAARRSAFDEAIDNFKRELDKIHTQRTAVLLQAISEYKVSGGELFGKSKESCESGADVKIVRKDLRDGLKDIRDNYRENVNSFGGHGEEIHELNEAKKKAMNQAKDNFKEILSRAIEDLKTAFPEIDEMERL